jgi:hypothetical protein
MTTITRDYLSPISRDNLSLLRRASRVADQPRLDTRDPQVRATFAPIFGRNLERPGRPTEPTEDRWGRVGDGDGDVRPPVDCAG